MTRAASTVPLTDAVARGRYHAHGLELHKVQESPVTTCPLWIAFINLACHLQGLRHLRHPFAVNEWPLANAWSTSSFVASISREATAGWQFVGEGAQSGRLGPRCCGTVGGVVVRAAWTVDAGVCGGALVSTETSAGEAGCETAF